VDDNMSKYELVEKPKNELGMFKVIIKADSNDADYVTTINTYPKDKFEKHIVPEIIDLMTNYRADYKLPDFEAHWLDIPYGEYDCCHSLEKITVEYIDHDGRLWNVRIPY
jgi:hypothetical protein